MAFLKHETVLHISFLSCAHTLKWPRLQVWVFGKSNYLVIWSSSFFHETT